MDETVLDKTVPSLSENTFEIMVRKNIFQKKQICILFNATFRAMLHYKVYKFVFFQCEIVEIEYF
jgi:hypothetical protein